LQGDRFTERGFYDTVCPVDVKITGERVFHDAAALELDIQLDAKDE
jgi:hypothetical protein